MLMEAVSIAFCRSAYSPTVMKLRGDTRKAVGHNAGSSVSANVMIVYIHGFNSSPASHKSNQLRERLSALGRGAEFVCPALPHWPKQAMALLEREVARVPADGVTLVGSSLGGFYA